MAVLKFNLGETTSELFINVTQRLQPLERVQCKFWEYDKSRIFATTYRTTRIGCTRRIERSMMMDFWACVASMVSNLCPRAIAMCSKATEVRTAVSESDRPRPFPPPPHLLGLAWSVPWHPGLFDAFLHHPKITGDWLFKVKGLRAWFRLFSSRSRALFCSRSRALPPSTSTCQPPVILESWVVVNRLWTASDSNPLVGRGRGATDMGHRGNITFSRLQPVCSPSHSPPAPDQPVRVRGRTQTIVACRSAKHRPSQTRRSEGNQRVPRAKLQKKAML